MVYAFRTSGMRRQRDVRDVLTDCQQKLKEELCVLVLMVEDDASTIDHDPFVKVV